MPAVALATPEAVGQPLIGLTPQQYATLLELASDGPDNNELAARLGITADTVKSHIKSLLALTGYSTRTELVVAYLRGRFGVGVGLPSGTRIEGEQISRTYVRSRLGRPASPRPVKAKPEPVVHAMGAWFTDCCHLPPTDLPGRDRITRDPTAVTCDGRDVPVFD